MDKTPKVIDFAAIMRNIPQDQKDYLQHILDTNTLSEQVIQLTKDHPDQWAGACDGEVIIAPTRDALIAQFGDRAPRMAWAFLSSKKIRSTFLAAA